MRSMSLIGDSLLRFSGKRCAEEGTIVDVNPGSRISHIKGTNNLGRGYNGGPGYDGGWGKREALHSMADLLSTAKRTFPNSFIIVNSVNVLEVSRFFQEGRCELAAAIFQFRQFSLLVVTAYKPKPFSASVQEHEMFYECLSDCLHNITNPAVRTVVVGDFNVNLSVPDIKVDKLLSMMASHDLSNKVTSFTREFKNSRSLIDHVYTDLSEDIFSCSVVINALSDHHAQISHVRCLSSPGCPKFMLKRSFVEENLRIFRNLLGGETWHDVYAARTMDDKMSFFMSSIEFYFIQAFPEKRVRIRGRSQNAKVSLTQDQIELRDLVVHWYHKTKDLSSSDERIKHYLSLKRQFRASVREAKSSKVKY
ncbi:hypothetical protein J6590_067705 [Homalodisca vitripennis]|nr:hypothetical protein J6590_067705 [Homalodisca vitripennis]